MGGGGGRGKFLPLFLFDIFLRKIFPGDIPHLNPPPSPSLNPDYNAYPHPLEL